MTTKQAREAGYKLTNEREVRRAFWAENPHLPHRRTVKMGDERCYPTDTRTAFCDFVDYHVRNGIMPATLGDRVTL